MQSSEVQNSAVPVEAVEPPPAVDVAGDDMDASTPSAENENSINDTNENPEKLEGAARAPIKIISASLSRVGLYVTMKISGAVPRSFKVAAEACSIVNGVVGGASSVPLRTRSSTQTRATRSRRASAK
eukprot:4787421-Prymnesium_polylepis.1